MRTGKPFRNTSRIKYKIFTLELFVLLFFSHPQRVNFQDKFTEILTKIRFVSNQSRTVPSQEKEIKQEKSNKLLNFTFINSTHQAGTRQGTFSHKFCNEFENF